tara:strand:+ start:765 stop:1094 length:330 start_codon:yes stop_codon:yes gene_type:complete
MEIAEIDETTQIYFEAVQDCFLELCTKYEIPKPKLITLSDDGTNCTAPPSILTIAVDLRVSSISQARHLFGHWLAGLHYPPYEDLVADAIADMVGKIENSVTFSSPYSE